MKFPTLFKRTKTGAIQVCDIEVLGNEVHTTFGQLGTSSPQVAIDVVKEGKNLGRANATTKEEQKKLIIVNFIALLELLRTGTIQATQNTEGGDITIATIPAVG